MDDQNGLPSLSGSGQLVRVGVQASDDGNGDIVPGEAESQGEVLVVMGINGNGVAGSPSIGLAL